LLVGGGGRPVFRSVWRVCLRFCLLLVSFPGGGGDLFVGFASIQLRTSKTVNAWRFGVAFVVAQSRRYAASFSI